MIVREKTSKQGKVAMFNGTKNETDGELSPLPANTAKKIKNMFFLLADGTRLQILHYLMQREELNVRNLCELLGQSQPAVSHHLSLLREADMIECRRDGKHNFYHIRSSGFRELMETLFSADPNQRGRIRFDDFVLAFMPDN